MDKKFFINKVNDIFWLHSKTIKLFTEQINNYYLVKEKVKLKKHEYNIGDEVVLEKGMFMRGEGAISEMSDDKLRFIAEHGFITPDLTKKYNKNQKTPFTIPVWNIQSDMLLKDYIKLYSGATIRIYSLTSKESKTELIPYKQIDKYVNNLDNFWKWDIEQTKENRFMPSLSNKRIQLGFIINTKNKLTKELIKNDIFNLEFDKRVLKTFIAKWFRDKFIYDKRDDFTTNREGAIVFGIPANLIEGILVGREYEKNKKILDFIKELFPKCYICNLDGKVIVI